MNTTSSVIKALTTKDLTAGCSVVITLYNDNYIATMQISLTHDH